ncbi:cytochrome c oxidase assembly factor Coa1 family protein [Pyxidicoccus caerfyrddinensis]|uniref:cytochrome c oxidase assembly factor Coa1 family protein n=1 Tax=Pyxidicoccus caerfyrddinensis TaxID=2709663 RepID=UPI0013D9A90A|nr:cytochrome c oxidase assembly factor Coa1 family protein [Pyxidicoccus caerfyrddinensis]
MDTVPEGSLVPQRGWWSRNWKWMVPVGCLGIVASCGCLGAVLAYAGFSSLSKMGAYTEAVALATGDAEVQRALGAPIDPGLPRQSSVSSNNGRTEARFSIPLDGPKADGTLQVDAEQSEGGAEWHYRKLAVEVEDGRVIDLRDDAPSAEPDEAEPGDEPEEDGMPPPTPKPPVPPEPPFGAEPPGRDAPADEKGDSDIEL